MHTFAKVAPRGLGKRAVLAQQSPSKLLLLGALRKPHGPMPWPADGLDGNTRRTCAEIVLRYPGRDGSSVSTSSALHLVQLLPSSGR